LSILILSGVAHLNRHFSKVLESITVVHWRLMHLVWILLLSLT